MAKLFATVESERTGKHQIANGFLDIKVYYGSRDNSKLLSQILVKANGLDIPEFYQHNTVNPKAFVPLESIQVEKILRK